jgi:hypothetical protein
MGPEEVGPKLRHGKKLPVKLLPNYYLELPLILMELF